MRLALLAAAVPALRPAYALLAFPLVLLLPGPALAVTTTTFAATDGARVEQDKPTTKFRTSELRTRGGSALIRSYMKFSPKGLTGTVTNATLSIVPLNASGEGFSVFGAASDSWSEKTLTWANAPAIFETRVAESGSYGCCGRVLVDITPLVRTDGTVTVVLTSSKTGSYDAYNNRTSGTAKQPQLIVTTTTASSDPAVEPTVLLQDGFDTANGPNDLITNEYAFWNPWDALAVRSNNWWMGSGSFFSSNGVGTSGKPDTTSPDRYSERSTNSATFRLHTQRSDFADAHQEVSVRVDAWTSAIQGYEGVQLWPKFVDGQTLYFAYILRKDGKIAMNKKCPGEVAGGEYHNGGTYFPLVHERYYGPTELGRWYKLGTSVRDNADGSVTVTMYREGVKVMEAVDSGVGCGPLRGQARLGIRGDNTQFSLDNYVVEAR